MRKIKFRGQSINGKEWVFGSLLKPYDNELPNYIYENLSIGHAIIPETIGQFTGLTDKNGVEIYEGDILGGCNGSINGHEWKQEPITITFEYGRFNVPLWAAKGEWDSTHYLIVIGNIHDNPELLQ